VSEFEHVVPLEGAKRFLDERFGESDAPIEVTKLGEGHSNLTFTIRRGDESWVLRRPPRGDILPGTHEMHREFTVMKALSDGGSVVPVPTPFELCEDDSYIGAPFYLMDHVEGVVVRGVPPEGFDSPDARRRMGEELVDRLADISMVDWQGIGLGHMARKPEQFLVRNVNRMQQLYDAVRHRDVPEIDEVGAWLVANTPEQRDVSLTHGDYKLDNVMYAPDEPRIVAVVDWEISTIGDPMVDLGWMLYFSPESSREDLSGAGVGAIGGGYPSRADLAKRYAERTGRPIEDLRFYCAMAGWKIAIIMEGSNLRFKQGNSDDSMFAALDAGVPALARRSLEIISGEAPVGV
jgi:aminoglycoside phosphotransferase (APT) family kinase protein